MTSWKTSLGFLWEAESSDSGASGEADDQPTSGRADTPLTSSDTTDDAEVSADTALRVQFSSYERFTNTQASNSSHTSSTNSAFNLSTGDDLLTKATADKTLTAATRPITDRLSVVVEVSDLDRPTSERADSLLTTSSEDGNQFLPDTKDTSSFQTLPLGNGFISTDILTSSSDVTTTSGVKSLATGSVAKGMTSFVADGMTSFADSKVSERKNFSYFQTKSTESRALRISTKLFSSSSEFRNFSFSSIISTSDSVSGSPATAYPASTKYLFVFGTMSSIVVALVLVNCFLVFLLAIRESRRNKRR